MPLEQPTQIPQIEVSPITEQELQKPGAAKLLYKRVIELENENHSLKVQLDTERARKEQIGAQLHEADARRQVLEEKEGSLQHRNAVSQLIWGALALILSLAIEFARSSRGIDLGLCILAMVFLGVAAYLVNLAPRNKRAGSLQASAKSE